MWRESKLDHDQPFGVVVVGASALHAASAFL
jgi:hypothetical protein